MKKKAKPNKKKTPKQPPLKEQLHSVNLTIDRILSEIGSDKVLQHIASEAEAELDDLEWDIEEEQAFIESIYAGKASRAYLTNLKKAKTAHLKAIKLLVEYIKQKKIADELLRKGSL